MMEPSMRLRSSVALILMVGVLLEFHGLKIQRLAMAQSLKDKQLVERIGKMEQNIQLQALGLRVTGEDSSLQGIAILGQTDYVIINDEVRKMGDQIGDYVISEITADTLTLRHQKSGEQIVLDISESKKPQK